MITPKGYLEVGGIIPYTAPNTKKWKSGYLNLSHGLIIFLFLVIYAVASMTALLYAMPYFRKIENQNYTYVKKNDHKDQR